MAWQRGIPYPVYERQQTKQDMRPLLAMEDYRIAYAMALAGGMPSDRDSLLMFIARWAMHQPDCRTFVVSEALCHALRDTDMRKVDESLIRLPFHNMYVDVSAAKIPIGGWFGDGVEGIFEGALLIQAPEEEEEQEIKDHIVVVSVVRCVDDTDGISYNLVKRSMIADLLSENKELDSGNDFLRLVMNSILYVNSVNADVREEWLKQGLAKKAKQAKGSRKRKLREQLTRFGKVHRVGSKFIHIPHVPQAHGSGRDGRKVGVRFMVRGHWRWLWYGPRKGGERIRKPKWIAPFWKGPEVADIVHREYQVEGKQRRKE